jgi:methylated-DNA-protein-cysteine methyltransferase related protein
LTTRRFEVLRRARTIPEGRVTTYGDLCPEAPRFAGAVLAATGEAEVPWQRVVRADGSLAKGEPQRRLLEAEGVPFRGERVDMRRAWMPPSHDVAEGRPEGPLAFQGSRE